MTLTLGAAAAAAAAAAGVTGRETVTRAAYIGAYTPTTSATHDAYRTHGPAAPTPTRIPTAGVAFGRHRSLFLSSYSLIPLHRPDRTKSADFVGYPGLVRSGPCSGI